MTTVVMTGTKLVVVPAEGMEVVSIGTTGLPAVVAIEWLTIGVATGVVSLPYEGGTAEAKVSVRVTQRER